MKHWNEGERGGSGTQSGQVKSRDLGAYRKLRQFGFSKEFMVNHWYVPDRDRPAPHITHRTKACKACGAVRKNDFVAFPKEVFGDRKLGRFTTGDVCRTCVAAAIQTGHRERAGAERDAKIAYEAHGSEMWERKSEN